VHKNNATFKPVFHSQQHHNKISRPYNKPICQKQMPLLTAINLMTGKFQIRDPDAEMEIIPRCNTTAADTTTLQFTYIVTCSSKVTACNTIHLQISLSSSSQCYMNVQC